MRIGLVSGIAGCGDSRLIRPVPDAETLPISNLNGGYLNPDLDRTCQTWGRFQFSGLQND